MGNASAYFGCVGQDKYSETLESCAREAGVNVRYQRSSHPTGRCAVLITGQDRSLVTKLDAANHFTVAHLEEPDNWKVVEAAKAVYSAGFFLTVSVDSMLKVGKFCAENNKTYCLNLSAPFLIQFFKDQMMSVMPYADIVFGNETEALTFAESFNLGTQDIKKIALAISMLPKENGTKGAGDAFVGGFLAQHCQGAELATSVRCGIWAASHIIQQSGCTFDEKLKFK